MSSKENITERDKWLLAIVGGLLFVLVSSPITYMITNNLSFGTLLTPAGCPSFYGILVHTIVFIILIRLMLTMK